MDKQDYTWLFDCIHPHFFENQYIRNIPDERTFDEMILQLDEFDFQKYDKKMSNSVSFGYFAGDMRQLQEAVKKVIPDWVQYYDEKQRAYCGYIDGKVASFCLIEDMGIHNINGYERKIGGPGCVGTLPEYRDRGIGLTMVKNVTQILKEEGYDYSYIHYTGVASWYEKLGYRTSIRWNKHGIL